MNVLLLIALACMSAPQQWHFDSERVEVTIGDGSFEVAGDYWFEAGDDPLHISYPFPDDPSLGRPELVEAFMVDQDGRRPLLVDTDDDRTWRWILDSSSAAVHVHVRYRQPMVADRAVYVLRSAAGWERPLSWAELIVVSPTNRVVSVTPTLERTKEGFAGRFEKWRPAEDLVVELDETSGGPPLTIHSGRP